jgi:hypothetical protein
LTRPHAADLLPLVAAAALPLIFLHARYQAETTIGPIGVYGSDVAVLFTVLAATVSGFWLGWEPLARGRWLWLFAGLLLALFLISNFWQPLEKPTKHLTSAAKYVEYALLAPSVVLLFRRAVDLERFLWVFVLWAFAAGGWGLLMFFGIVDDPEGPRPGQREVSFLGHQDLGSFTGAALAVGFAALVLGRRRRLMILAVIGGGLGVMIDASVFAYLGVVLAALVAAIVARRAGTLTLRRLVALAAIVVVVGGGVGVLRGSDVSQYMSFLGITPAKHETGVQTGAQRTTLLWIGWKIFEHHPILGVGFDRSPNRYQPFLAEAKRKFPNQPAESYPSPAHPWGIQNFWLQVPADTGIAGLALVLATFAVGLWTALGVARSKIFFGLVATGFILVAAGTLNAIGLVAGIPLEAVTWLGFGLAVVAAGLP